MGVLPVAWRRGLIGCSLTAGLTLCLAFAAGVAALNVPALRGSSGLLLGNTMAVCALTSTTPPTRIGLSWDACPFCSSLVVNPAQWHEACLFVPWPFGVVRGSLTP
jgi:hypothetical protein